MKALIARMQFIRLVIFLILLFIPANVCPVPNAVNVQLKCWVNLVMLNKLWFDKNTVGLPSPQRKCCRTGGNTAKRLS